MRKPFDPNLFGENDKRAREAARRMFGHKYLVLDNPYKYDPDLLIYFPDFNFAGYMEVEVKQFWDGHDFTGKTIHIPERKSKFLGFDKIVFCVFNKQLTRCAWIHGDDLAKAPKIKKPNKYMSSDEWFFEIPIEWMKFSKAIDSALES